MEDVLSYMEQMPKVKVVLSTRIVERPAPEKPLFPHIKNCYGVVLSRMNFEKFLDWYNQWDGFKKVGETGDLVTLTEEDIQKHADHLKAERERGYTQFTAVKMPFGRAVSKALGMPSEFDGFVIIAHDVFLNAFNPAGGEDAMMMVRDLIDEVGQKTQDVMIYTAKWKEDHPEEWKKVSLKVEIEVPEDPNAQK